MSSKKKKNPWYVQLDVEVVLGPMPFDALAELAASGSMLVRDNVRQGRFGEWQRADEVPGLFDRAACDFESEDASVEMTFESAVSSPEIATKVTPRRGEIPSPPPRAETPPRAGKLRAETPARESKRRDQRRKSDSSDGKNRRDRRPSSTADDSTAVSAEGVTELDDQPRLPNPDEIQGLFGGSSSNILDDELDFELDFELDLPTRPAVPVRKSRSKSFETELAATSDAAPASAPGSGAGLKTGAGSGADDGNQFTDLNGKLFTDEPGSADNAEPLGCKSDQPLAGSRSRAEWEEVEAEIERNSNWQIGSAVPPPRRGTEAVRSGVNVLSTFKKRVRFRWPKRIVPALFGLGMLFVFGLLAQWGLSPSLDGIQERLVGLYAECVVLRAERTDSAKWNEFSARAQTELNSSVAWLEESAMPGERRKSLLLYAGRDLRDMIATPPDQDVPHQQRLAVFFEQLDALSH